jgi:hypothetical protein
VPVQVLELVSVMLAPELAQVLALVVPVLARVQVSVMLAHMKFNPAIGDQSGLTGEPSVNVLMISINPNK